MFTDMIKKTPKEITELIENDYRNIVGVVALKGNETIYENYFHGYCQTEMIHIASVTKSVVSILIGIAIDKGLIKSVEQNALDFFPEYQVKRREQTIQKVTEKHLLTMTAPYKFKAEP